MQTPTNHFNRKNAAEIGPRFSNFEEYRKIQPVAIAYKKGARIFVSEFQDARKLLKELWRLGRAKIDLRGVISGRGALDAQNLARLNVYLQHHFSRQSLNSLRAGQLHRYTWHEMQRAVPLAWTA